MGSNHCDHLIGNLCKYNKNWINSYNSNKYKMNNNKNNNNLKIVD